MIAASCSKASAAKTDGIKRCYLLSFGLFVCLRGRKVVPAHLVKSSAWLREQDVVYCIVLLSMEPKTMTMDCKLYKLTLSDKTLSNLMFHHSI